MAQEARSWPGVAFGVGAMGAIAVFGIACAASSDKGRGDDCRGTDCGVHGDTAVGDVGIETDSGGGADTADTAETPDCTPPAGKVCTTLPQCGCLSAENCDVTDPDGNTSCVAAGPVALHKKCSARGECAKGLSCFGSPTSLCRPFCNSTADCKGSIKGVCQNVTGGGPPPKDIPDYKICLVECDPMMPSKACGTAGCAFFTATQTACIAAGSVTSGGACKNTPTNCVPGYSCDGAVCRKWCRIGMDKVDCSGKAAVCQQVFSPVPKYNGATYGLCNQ